MQTRASSLNQRIFLAYSKRTYFTGAYFEPQCDCVRQWCPRANKALASKWLYFQLNKNTSLLVHTLWNNPDIPGCAAQLFVNNAVPESLNAVTAYLTAPTAFCIWQQCTNECTCVIDYQSWKSFTSPKANCHEPCTFGGPGYIMLCPIMIGLHRQLNDLI